MKVWLSTVGEPSPHERRDVRLLRTGMLAKTLTKRGHDVTWWSSSFDHFGKRHLANDTIETKWEGGRLVLLHSDLAYKRNVSVSRIVHNVRTARVFREKAASYERPDVFVVSFPTIELANEAVRYGQMNDVPVVVDVRDLWPDIFALAVPEPVRPLARLALYPFIKQTRAALRSADAIIGVSEGYLEWGLAYAGRSNGPRDRVFPIGYEDTLNAGASIAPESWLKENGIDTSKILVWFVGSFGRSYDLETVIRCAREMEADGESRFQFVISGDGEARSALEQQAKGLESVRFTGWIQGDQIRLLQRKANLGLMAYAKSAAQGLPNKLFEYMSAGIPVVSSLEGEGAGFISVNGIGLNYAPQEPRSLRSALVRFSDDPEFMRSVSQRSRELFLAQFDSKIIYDRLASYVEEIGSR